MSIFFVVLIVLFVVLLLFLLVVYVVGARRRKERERLREMEYVRERREQQRQKQEIFENRRKYVYLKTTAPIRFSTCDVVYYEPAYDEEVNAFIASCSKVYPQYDHTCYLNYYPERTVLAKDLIRYNNPNLSDDQMDRLNLEPVGSIADLLSPYLVAGEDPRPIEPCLIRLMDPKPMEYKGETVYRCSYCSLRPTQHYSMEQVFEWYVKHLEEDVGVRYSKAHDAFSDEIEKLSKEILERMDRLRTLGVDDSYLRQLALPQVELSPILITRDYRIVLPLFNHLEIKMEPVQRALYVLFLRHPEGILFKHLSDYRHELMTIYSAVSNRGDKKQMEKTVERLTDPTDNSINEKCARIREAFVKEFSDELARHYYVYGQVAQEKKIALAGEEGMVIFDNNK